MDADHIANILDRANDLLEAGQPGETLRCLAQLEHAPLERDDHIESATLRAWALSELDNHDAALAVLDPLLEQYPDSSRLYAARGVVLSNADELDEAQYSLEEAYALDEEDEVTVANLALVCEKRRDFETAQALYEQALSLGADIDWTLQRKAAVQTELGDYAAAKGTIRRYLSLAPEDAAQWTALGILHSDDEEYERAFECYRAAESADADSGWLRLNWGVTAVRSGDIAVAKQQLDLLRLCAGSAARPWLLSAFIREEEDDEAGAAQSYDAALRELGEADDPEDQSYVLEMAIDFFARRGEPTRCDALLKQAYLLNACSVELCEAFREARGEQCDTATWFSVVTEADYREGLEEVRDRGLPADTRPTRFLRNYQIIARDRDEATALVLEFMERMGETATRVREFINDEPMDDTYVGIYEVERKVLATDPEAVR